MHLGTCVIWAQEFALMVIKDQYIEDITVNAVRCNSSEIPNLIEVLKCY